MGSGMAESAKSGPQETATLVDRGRGSAEAATVRPVVRLLPYQGADVHSEARFRWCCWSRQSGKSFSKSLRRLLRGLRRRRNQIFLSAGERQSAELMQKVRQHCQVMNIAHEFLGSQFFRGTRFRQLEVRLPNGLRILGLPANPLTIRGFTGDVLLDEFAMHAFDREIWAAVFPTILRSGGELDVASTPRGRKNVFYQLASNTRFERSIVTLPEAVAQGLQVDVDDLRRSMGDEQLFRQEFLCEFLDESTAFLTYEQIAACEEASLNQHTSPAELAERGGDLFAGVDIGRHRDLTVIWVLERKGAVLLTVGVYELSGATFRTQYGLLSELLGIRTLRRCCLDAGGIGMQLAESLVEDFGPHRVEAVTFTLAVKEELAGRLRVAVEQQRIRIPASEAIRNDWHSVQRWATSGGHMRYEASRSCGSHADRFWAAALAVQAAASAPDATVSWSPGLQPRFSRDGVW
jgi:phage FluMu gp28-like protein